MVQTAEELRAELKRLEHELFRSLPRDEQGRYLQYLIERPPINPIIQPLYQRKRRGQTGKTKTARRREVIAQLVGTGTLKPSTILAHLLEHHTELARVNGRDINGKTIRNDLASLAASRKTFSGTKSIPKKVIRDR